MGGLLDPLQYAILPVFAFTAIGFVLGRRGLFSADHARGANQYVIGVAAPCITFYLTARAEFADIDWRVIAAYVGTNLLLFGYGYWIARSGFGLGRAEAFLLGMAGSFPNHVFFSLPIVEQLYGAEAALPLGVMIAVDILVIFGGSIVVLEAATGRRGFAAALGGVARNRLLLAIAAGFAFNASGLEFHAGAERFLALAAASGAPPALFALGVIMAAGDLRRIGGPAWAATLIRVGVHPFLGWILLGEIVPASDELIPVALMAFGAPCGALAFSLGLRYGIEVQSVAKAIILSTVLSVFTFALIA